MDAPPKISSNYSDKKKTKDLNPTETPKIENIAKTVDIVIGNKIFKLDFQNKIDYLLIVAKNQDNPIPIEYSGKFELKDIQKIGLFRDYESVDECLFEIFEGLDSKLNCIENENRDLIISVPLHTKKYPEISFTLKINQKSDSEKYDDLCDAFLNMKKQKDEEIKLLKEKIENLENLLQIKSEDNNEKNEKFEGTTFEVFTIGKDIYYDYFPNPNVYDTKLYEILSTFTFECNEDDTKSVMDKFKEKKEEIKEILYLGPRHELNVRCDKNLIFVDLLGKPFEKKNYPDAIFDDLIRLNDPVFFASFMTNKIKAKLRTEATLIDLFEVKDEDKIDDLILNTKLDFEGLTLKSQMFMSFLTILSNKYRDAFFPILTDIFLSLMNGNVNYQIPNKEIFDDYERDKKEFLLFLKDFSFNVVNGFRDPEFKIFRKVNFNKIKVGIIGSPKFKVGFLGINFESPKNNEFIDKIFNNKINRNKKEEK